MTVLVVGGLEVADRGHMTVGQVLVEPVQVVLVVGLPVAPDLGQAGRGQVVRVGGGGVVLERVVVRVVVRDGDPADVGVATAADRGAVAGPRCRCEPALEPAPGDAAGVEQVADVLPAHLDRGVGVVGTAVVVRVRVAVDRAGVG